MSNKHALSVFTHSCLSTPRNPRTKLPSTKLDEQLNRSAPHLSYHDRPHTTGGVFRRSRSRHDGERTNGDTSFEASLHSVSGHHATLHHPQLSPGLAPDPHGTSQKILSQSTGSVPTSSHPDPELLSGNVRPSTSGGYQQSADYSTLFNTLLESNSLLREEIKKLREEQQRTLSTVAQLNRRDCAIQTNGINGPHLSNHKATNGHSPLSCGNGENGFSQSLPQRLLENTWIESSSDHSPLHSSSSSLLSHQEEYHSLDGEGLDHAVNDELNSLSSTSLDSVSVEEVDAEQIHMDSNDSLPEHQEEDGGILSNSDESMLSDMESSTTTSESESRPSQAAEDDPFASPGVVAVEKMWDDFSIDEYAPYTPGGYDDERTTGIGVKEWTPRITIPQPFSMSIRDANSQKAKSRSMLIAEEECLKREALEEAELRKKFHSSPVPATTYLPLYELINAKNEQRREQIKQSSKAVLKSTEKPFSFMKREEEKRKNKLEALRQSQEFEISQKKETMFVAKPVPKHVFDSSVDDKIEEQEEYRRIRMQMRAEELLLKSKLPGSMQVKGREYTVGSLRKKRFEENKAKAFLTDEHKFHPAISSDVPDYDQAYFEFQNELARRKESKQTTTTKPFYLRTQMIPSRKEQVVKDMETDEVALPENRWPFVGSRSKVPRLSPKPSSSSVAYPAQMTKTAKVRESLTREKLASESKKELLEEDEERRRREREKLVRQSVTQKSLSLDPTAWLEEKKRRKLQEVRRIDKERQNKYKQELKEMEGRVQSRPLLLEQTSLKSAMRSAESKYTAALKKAGLSENDIQTLTTS